MVEIPEPEEVAAQLERLHGSRRFRGLIVKGLLDFIVAEWLKDGGRHLSLRFIAHQHTSEPETLEEDTQRWGYPKTRGNLGHVRTRLKAYYEDEGYRDPVIIKLNAGSYIPLIARNRVSTGIPDLDPPIARLVLRAKTAIDTRTLRGAQRALSYYLQIPLTVSNPRQAANVLFIPMAVASIIPSAPRAIADSVEPVLAKIKEQGAAPWEAVFTEACAAACYRRDWKKALEVFELSITLSHGEAAYFWWYTALLTSLGRTEEAIEILDGAVRHFSRTNIATRTDLALLQIMSGKFAEAEEHLSSTLDFIAADNAVVAGHFALLYEAQDRLNEAILALVKVSSSGASMRAAVPYGDGYILTTGLQVLIFGRAGLTDVAAELLAILMSCKENNPACSSVEIAFALIGLSRFNEAVDWLNRAAFEESDPTSMWFHLLPPLRHLRGHAGFAELLRKLGLPAK